MLEISASTVKDKFGNVEFGAMGGTSAAKNLHSLIAGHFEGWRGEFQITESLPMCAADRMSKVDREEAFLLGKEAVKLATSGKSGVMVCLNRVNNSPYRIKVGTCPLDEVAVKTRPIPDEFIFHPLLP